MPNPPHDPRFRWTIILLGLGAIALLAYSAERARSLSFTHDESLTYTIVAGDDVWKGFWHDTANNHPLNTRLMKWTHRAFGSAEWSLRLPNVLGHAIYLVAGLALFAKLSEWPLLIAGFSLVNLNPFLLDFFGLARGYGLALALSMAALLFLRLAWERTEFRKRAASLVASLTCAALADLGNYAWLNIHFAVLAAALGLLLFDEALPGFRRNRAQLAFVATLLGANIWFIRNVTRSIWKLNASGGIYVGGSEGFIRNTLGTLVTTWFYYRPHPAALEWILPIAITVAGALILIAVSYRTWRDRRVDFGTILCVMTVVAVAAVVAEHAILGTLYPEDRAALGYIPLGAAAAAFALDRGDAPRRAAFRRSLKYVLSLALAAILIAQFGWAANLRKTYIWPFDANTRFAMLALREAVGPETGRTIRIANSKDLEPTINFYRATLGYRWLAPATRNPINLETADAVYCYPEDLAPILDRPPMTVLAQYPESETLLIRVNRK